MQPSIADEIRWRYNLYCNIEACCRQGNFSLARFAALIPDRLRLAVGESLAKIQIPVFISDAFIQRCADLIAQPSLIETQASASEEKIAEARRAIRFAQIDGNLDSIVIAAWLERNGDAFLKAVSGLYLKALGEIGHGEGGEETAYLVHLLLLHAFNKALLRTCGQLSSAPVGNSTTVRPNRTGAPPDQCAFLSSLLGLALQGLLETDALPSDVLSARLGLQMTAMNSPFTLGAKREEILRHPVNAYRTTVGAVRLMEAQLRRSPDGLRFQESVSEVSVQLLAQPATRTELVRELACEMLRDCMLLATHQLQRPQPTQLFKMFRRLATSSARIFELVNDRVARDQLIHVIDLQPQAAEQPFPTLRRLLAETERALSGATHVLRSHADLKQRAQLTAMGALLVILDEKMDGYSRELLERVRFVPESRHRVLYEEGRCYVIDFDSRPLYQLPKTVEEAHLFVDVKDFTRRTVAIKEQAMGDFLKRYFYDPIFQLAAKLKQDSGDRLAISNILGDAVAFRGDIHVIVSLAVGIRKILAEAQKELAHSLSDVVGGGDPVLAEIDEAIERAQAAIEEIDGNQALISAERPERIAEQRKRLGAQLQMLRESRQLRQGRTVGQGLEAGAYVSFGAAAEAVYLDHPAFGAWSVTVGERLNEAARGTARSSTVKAAADALLARTRQERKSPSLDSPFQVHLGKRYQLDLAISTAESLESAVYRGDKNAVTASIREIAQSLHHAASKNIDRHDGSLPSSVTCSEELYNGGCVLSGAALQAFEKTIGRSMSFQRSEVYRAQLPESFHKKYLLEHDPERFWIARDSATGQAHHLLRYSGKALFRGFEGQGEIDLWELILIDSNFGQDLTAVLEASEAAPQQPQRERRAR